MPRDYDEAEQKQIDDFKAWVEDKVAKAVEHGLNEADIRREIKRAIEYTLPQMRNELN